MKNYYYILISFILLGISFYLFRDINVIPIHFNIHGKIDAYGSKYYIILFLLIPVLIVYLMDILKKIDPKYLNYKDMNKEYNMFKFLIASLLYAIYIVFIISTLSSFNILLAINTLLGIFLILMGKYLKNLKQNYFLGIKTPWTLNNEIVWEKTHKRSSVVFIIIGISFLINIFLKSFIPFIILILGLMYIFYYSYKINKVNN